MTDEITEPLTNTIIDVLEKQAFAFVDTCEKHELVDELGPFVYTRINFDGPTHGTLGVALPQTLGTELATNILGIDFDEIITEEDTTDALKELINVACGQWLTSYYGSEPIFNLEIPTSLTLDQPKWQALIDQEDSIGFMIEDAPTLAHVSLLGK